MALIVMPVTCGAARIMSTGGGGGAGEGAIEATERGEGVGGVWEGVSPPMIGI